MMLNNITYGQLSPFSSKYPADVSKNSKREPRSLLRSKARKHLSSATLSSSESGTKSKSDKASNGSYEIETIDIKLT